MRAKDRHLENPTETYCLRFGLGYDIETDSHYRGIALMSVTTLENPTRTEDIPLQQLNPGQLAKVAGLYGTNHDVARLAEMGLRQGTVVSVTRGGITSIVQLLNGSRLCVRTSNELVILVTPL